MRFVFALSSMLVACTGGGGGPIHGNGSDGGTVHGSDGGNNHGSDGGTVGGSDSGTVGGSDGGTVSSSGLTFAVVGDTRPASVDDTANYPTPIITKIYQDVEAASPRPTFVVGTGDYQFASTSGSQQQPQLDLYAGARGQYSGAFYPAMGNHECTGYTASNCGSGNTDGTPRNYTDFITTMLSPIGETKPYYVKQVTASDNSWTAKLVFVACNAWDSTQASWLDQTLSQASTYTFVIRHESTSAVSSAPCGASDSTIDAHPLTLRIVGHSHYYSHVSSSKEIIVGNGGAPLTSGTNYGYVIINRNSDGSLTVTAYDYQSGSVLDTFKITASGAAA